MKTRTNLNRVNSKPATSFCLCEYLTVAVGEDGYAVDVVCVAEVDLDTLPGHHPSPHAGVVAAGEELCVAEDGQTPDAVLMAFRGGRRRKTVRFPALPTTPRWDGLRWLKLCCCCRVISGRQGL